MTRCYPMVMQVLNETLSIFHLKTVNTKLEAKDSQKNFFNPITTLCSSLWLERLLYSLFLC
jgi:hypothetical protein